MTQTYLVRRAGNLVKLHLSISGGQAKLLIQDGHVRVDGAPCTQRGKRLNGGELVEVEGFGAVRVVAPG